jgi:hypothetical protein
MMFCGAKYHEGFWNYCLVQATRSDDFATTALALENNLCGIATAIANDNNFLVVDAGNMRAIDTNAVGLVQGTAWTTSSVSDAMTLTIKTMASVTFLPVFAC